MLDHDSNAILESQIATVKPACLVPSKRPTVVL